MTDTTPVRPRKTEGGATITRNEPEENLRLAFTSLSVRGEFSLPVCRYGAISPRAGGIRILATTPAWSDGQILYSGPSIRDEGSIPVRAIQP